MRHPSDLPVELLRWFIFAACALLLLLAFSGCAHEAPVVCPRPPFYLQACIRVCAPRAAMMAIEDENGPHCICEQNVQPKDPT